MSADKWAFPPQRPTAGERTQSQEKVDNKSRWPGLNVVTNFPKGPAGGHQAVGGEAKQNAGLGLRKQQGGSIAASRKASVETLGLGHQPSPKSLRTLGSKGRLGDLKRASSKWSSLSPSDRAVVIGISVSPEELAHHSASPEVSPARPEGLSEQHAIDRRSAIMPSIVVTPAKEKAPWSNEDEQEPAQLFQPRTASSVYSHAPSHVGARAIDSVTVPPVPPLPPDVQGSNAQEGNKEPTKKRPAPRVVSNSTEIDETESKETDNEKTKSLGRSHLRVLTQRASMDSIATKHRSQGWWNHIVSPFFPKSPMNFKASQEPVPDVPSSVKQDQSLQQARQTFPPPPKSDGLRSSRTSWTDSTLDAEYEKRLELDGFHDRNTMIADEPQEGLVRDSAMLPTKFEGFGAAAEYYEACLYDMHSQIPYFECQNHVCLPPNPVKSVRPGDEASRAIEEHMGPGDESGREPKSEPPLAAQQAPMNRFSAAFLEAIKPNTDRRPKSDATVIEDLETTPDVQEARAAPVVRARAPIPAAQPPIITGPEAGSLISLEEPPEASKSPPAASALDCESPSSVENSSRAAPAPVHSSSPYVSPPHQSPTIKGSPRPSSSTRRPNTASENSQARQEKQPKRYVAVLPPGDRSQPAFEQPLSPEPLSPGQQRQAGKGAIPLEDVHRENPGLRPASDFVRGEPDVRDREFEQAPKKTMPFDETNQARTRYRPFEPSGDRHDRQDNQPEQITVADLYPPPRDPQTIQRSWQYREKDALPPRDPKKRHSFPIPRCKSCFNSAKPRNKKERKIIIAIGVSLVLLIILVVVLVMTLTLRKKGHKTAVQAQWLNLTNFPPIPTGVATIIQPDAVDENPDCVYPKTMWSCAVPKEEQQSLYPSAPDQPNFRVEIVFQNGTNATANSTIGNSSNIRRRSYGHIANPISASGYIRNRMLLVRDTFGGTHFTPSPAAPSLEEQSFLGNTTERNSAPFDGEFTPFFMSFESASKISSRLVKRGNSDNEDATDPFPNSTSGIPPPDANPDGTAAAANLYPYPSSQPLRLYNRGLDTEHYGFYTYFDRSIFLKSASPLDASGGNDTTAVPDDEDGGANENAASVRCTWAQTRFLVQIWTKKGNSATLLQSSNSTSKPTHHSSGNATTLSSSSANDFTQPGSFPYPVTITLDRHGGDITKKSIYCYGLDDREHYNASQKQFQIEDRGVDGQLVNPALGPFGDVNVTTAQGGPGGVDGGSGGCACRWQNYGTGL